ncbi:MAG: guanylate kinase, partial [Cyanobacteria bacterium P01_D01_bin.44]
MTVTPENTSAVLEVDTTSAVASVVPPVRSGRLIVFTGPSGVGKGTLLRQLLERHPDIQLSVSATTRQPRPGEVNGQHYHFVSRDTFNHMIEQGELLEWAEFAGNFYGTPAKSLA